MTSVFRAHHHQSQLYPSAHQSPLNQSEGARDQHLVIAQSRDRSSIPQSAMQTVSNGRIYTLEIVQQPVRARMCGFGDKDRRPITPPPCVRLRVHDAMTGQPLDINDIDTSYFILTVDLWSADGHREVNLVRHSATSPSISAATATSYPPTSDPSGLWPAQPQMNPRAFQPGYDQSSSMGAPSGGTIGGPMPIIPGAGAGHMYAYNVPPQKEIGQHMQYAQQYQREEAMRIQHQQQQMQNEGHTQPTPQSGSTKQHPPSQTYVGQPIASPANGMFPPHAPGQTGPVPSGMMYDTPTTPPMSVIDPRSQPSGMFTRNLIGSLACAAFKLTYPDDDLGVWFILQDLSVRTEGSFRLKLNFVDVGAGNIFNSFSNQSSIASSTNPQDPAYTTRNANLKSEGDLSSASPTTPLQLGSLNTASAPVLATTYSNEFQVFSAKKFPGVIDSTVLSKAFAKQGIKIPIRKDGGGRGNERRDWEDEDDEEGGSGIAGGAGAAGSGVAPTGSSGPGDASSTKKQRKGYENY